MKREPAKLPARGISRTGRKSDELYILVRIRLRKKVIGFWLAILALGGLSGVIEIKGQDLWDLLRQVK